MTEAFKKLCGDLEHWVTPWWAALKILDHEILTHSVLDPCTGTGVLADAAIRKGYEVWARDIQDWGYRPYPELLGGEERISIGDFLTSELPDIGDFSVFMNPPFSKACEFVQKSIDLGARKILCFQRMAFWESRGRREFWDKNPPSRVYICGDRATCWNHSIPEDQRTGGTTTPPAWFVWERGQPPGTQLHRLYKDDPKPSKEI